MERLRIAGAGDFGKIVRVTDGVLLCVETSTPRGSVALMEGGAVLFEASFGSDRAHNAALFAPLQQALAALGDRPLTAVIVGTGPGSYSGTRVGIAAAQGVAMVHGCAAVGLSSLMAVPALEKARSAVAIGDARRGNAWWVRVDAGRPVAMPQLIPVADLAAVIADNSGLPVFAVEDPARLGLESVTLEIPDAMRLGRAWLALNQGDRAALLSEPPQPVYLQPPHITQAKGGHPLIQARVF